MKVVFFFSLSLVWLGCAGGAPGGQPTATVNDDVQEREGDREQEQDCRAHSDCTSGVCSRYKKNNGKCATVACTIGERADNNHFFCNREGKWEKSRGQNEHCDHAYECYQATCFMNPTCELAPPPAVTCEKGKCVEVAKKDECERTGKKRVLAKDEWMQSDDGACMQSIAQRQLRTVCVPCGNGVCDKEESVCNCPEDCRVE